MNIFKSNITVRLPFDLFPWRLLEFCCPRFVLFSNIGNGTHDILTIYGPPVPRLYRVTATEGMGHIICTSHSVFDQHLSLSLHRFTRAANQPRPIRQTADEYDSVAGFPLRPAQLSGMDCCIVLLLPTTRAPFPNAWILLKIWETASTNTRSRRNQRQGIQRWKLRTFEFIFRSAIVNFMYRVREKNVSHL